MTILPLLFLVLAGLGPLAGQRPPERRTAHVVLVTLDGLRWQEVFGGADSTLVDDTTITAPLARARYWRNAREARREALMPFLWSEVAAKGQLFGDHASGGTVRVTNRRNFSYPGYQELLAGFPDDRIDSNDKRPNPNVTVLEWLNAREPFRGRVAVFGTWDVFPYIVHRERSGIAVNAGWAPLGLSRPTERQRLLNELVATLPRVWEGERYDALTYYAAKEYVLTERPRVLYLALGETDDWAHEGRYDRYLDAAHTGDRFLRDLWEALHTVSEYRGRTTLLVASDHGRGGTRADWSQHGSAVPGAEFIWIAVLGPDTPARGVRREVGEVAQGQVAATLAALLGADYRAAEPRAAPPLPGVVP